MDTDPTTPRGPAFPEKKPSDPTVAVTVLISKTTVGDVMLSKGAKIRLPKSQADTLASLNPPAVLITGI